MKTCKTCSIKKELSEFWKNKNLKDGHDANCIICSRERKKIFYNENKEKEKNRVNEYRNSEFGKISIKKYSETPKRKLSNYNHYNIRRQRIKTNSDGTVTQASLDKLLLNQEGMCNYCLKDIILREDRHLDHIFPLSKGGLHTINNLQWLCVKCNLSKFKCTYVTR